MSANTRRDRETTRRDTLIALTLSLAPWPAACGTVDPAEDYRETALLAGEHTGSAQVYQPDLDPEIVVAAVEGLLADGLTPEECVQVALLENEGFRAQFRQVGLSSADLVQAGLISNPILYGSIRIPDGTGRTDVTLNVVQSITDLMIRPIRKKIASAQLEQARFNVAQQAVDLAARVWRSVYTVLSLRAAEAISQENRTLFASSLQLAEDRLAAGLADAVDVQLARSNLLSVERELLVIQRDRRIAHAVLGREMGLARWPGDWDLVGTLPRPATIADDDALFRLAMAERLDLRVAEQRVQAAREDLRRQHWLVVPNVIVGAEAERGPMPPNVVGPVWGLSLPLWDQNRAQIARAGFLLQQRCSEYENQLDIAALDVQRAAAALRGDAALVRKFDDELLPQAQRAIDLARDAYEAGQRDILALTQAQTSAITVRREYVLSLREYATALADLQQAVGGRLDAALDMESAEGGGAGEGSDARD